MLWPWPQHLLHVFFWSVTTTRAGRIGSPFHPCAFGREGFSKALVQPLRKAFLQLGYANFDILSGLNPGDSYC